MSVALRNPFANNKSPDDAYRQLQQIARSNTGVARYLTTGSTSGLTSGDVQTINDVLRGTGYDGQPEYFIQQMQGKSAQANPVNTPAGQREMTDPAMQARAAQANPASFASFQASQAQAAANAQKATQTPANQRTAPPPSSAGAPPAAVRSPVERGPGFNDAPPPTSAAPGAPGQGPNENGRAAAANQAAATAPPAATNAPNFGAPTMPNLAGNPAKGASTLAQQYAYSGTPDAQNEVMRQVLQAMHLNPDNLGMLGDFITQNVGNIVQSIMPYLAFAGNNNGTNPDINSVIGNLAQGISGPAMGFTGAIRGLGQQVLGNPLFQSALNGQVGSDAIKNQQQTLGGLLPLLLFGASDLTKNAALGQFTQAGNRIQDAAYNALNAGAQAPTNFGQFVASNASGLAPGSILRSLLGL